MPRRAAAPPRPVPLAPVPVGDSLDRKLANKTGAVNMLCLDCE